MKIEIPENQIADIFSASVLQAMTPEVQQSLVEGAIRYLLSKPEPGYGSRESPMEQAFQNALFKLANKYAVEVLSKNEKIKTVMEEYGEKLVNLEWDDSELVKEAFSKALLTAIESKDSG